MSTSRDFKRGVSNKPSRLGDIKIVAIGGGTGQSVMLRGLKEFTSNTTAIVTVADDGGGSGILRDDLGMLPPGDIRNCLLALAEREDTLADLLNYRFSEGILKGQSFGNLFLAAMAGISPSFEDAVKRVSSVLKVKGSVLPVTVDDIRLSATLHNGSVVVGESIISDEVGRQNSPIGSIKIIPENAAPLPEALTAIRTADMIIISSGSLYTSILPNLVINGIAQEICCSNALKLYVCNVMTQYNETDRYTAFDHCQAIIDHTCDGIIDCCLVNTRPVPDEIRKRYAAEGSELVHIDYDRFEKSGIKLIEAELISPEDGYARHNPRKLAKLLTEIVQKHVNRSFLKTEELKEVLIK